MSVNFPNLFGSDLKFWLASAVNTGRLTLVKAVIEFKGYLPESLEPAVWQAGYNGYGEIADYLIANVEGCTNQSFLDGQLMKALDEKNIAEISLLVQAGGNLFQKNHSALYTPVTRGDLKMANYLLDLGLNPVEAFTEGDMEELRENVSMLIPQKALKWLEVVRLNYVDRESVSKTLHTPFHKPSPP